jgi:hypothetical protein
MKSTEAEVLAFAAREVALLQAGSTTPDNACSAHIDAVALLTEVHDFLGRFVAYPSPHAQVAHTLWCAHTHCMEQWHTTPRLAFMSEEKESGKTRALEISELLTPGALLSFNASPAALVRKISAGGVTILYDEIDALFGSAKREEGNLDVRSVLNSGYRRGAKTHRCVTIGKRIKVEELDAFAPVALAGLRNLPDMLASRAIIIRMRRRAPDEKIEQFRQRRVRPIAAKIYERLAAWCGSLELADIEPEMPVGVVDRAAECWEPLLIIADAAGGKWSNLARKAAAFFVQVGRNEAQSSGVELLEHIREAFEEKDRLSTDSLLERLVGRPESPWKDIHGRVLDDRGLARRLRGFGIRSTKIRIGTSTARGYRAEQFHDAWRRYLPVPEQTERMEQPSPYNDLSVPHVPHVPDNAPTEAGKRVNGEDIDPDDVPPSCRRCFHCGKASAVNAVVLPDCTVWLHRECEAAWFATHDKSHSPHSLNGGAA